MSDKHVHKHDHQPSDISLRVKAVESLLSWSRKVSSTRQPSTSS